MESCWGRRLAVLQSRTNVESYRFDFLASEGRADIAEQLWRMLFDARRWEVIHLEHIPEGSSTLIAGLAVAGERGWRAVVQPTFLTPWRPLSRAVPWDDGLKRKFKSNLRNRERRLATLGEVSFEVVTGDGALREALEVFYDLEAGGWKGEGGTAIARQQQVNRLYDRLLELAGEDMRIPILAVSGRAVAAHVLRVRGNIMFMLKTAYDEAYSAYAPGQLLTARVLQYGREHGLEALDFLADNADWKADWAPRFRQHDRLLLFAPSLPGRYAYWVRYGFREQAKRVPGLVGVIRWLKGRRR
jgi:CelD/BcsL family acetyltransferase involved in cellulose biosynthesis